MQRSLIVTLFSVSVLLAVGCAGSQVVQPIPDTPEAEAVVEVLNSYKDAMESKDVDAILAIASPYYHDRMGDADPETDVYYHDLEKKLAEDFEQVSNIRLDIEVLTVELEDVEDEAQVPIASVRYRYDVRYQLSMPSGEKWHNSLDINQMVLQREEDGVWRVLSGL